jgi:VWFA-related protein
MTRSPRTPASLAVLSALSLLLAAAGPRAAGDDGGKSQPPAPAEFFEQVQVSVVNVEVWVSDKLGNRVTGLAPTDFQVLEDGKPVEVTNFFTEEYSDSLLPAGGSAAAAAVAGTTAPEAAPAQPAPALLPAAGEPHTVPPDQQLNLVIFIDDLHILPADRKRVLDRLEGWVEDRVISGDNLMLVAFDRKLRVIQPFTHDRWAIVDGVHHLDKASAQGPLAQAQWRQTMGLIAQLASPSAGNRDMPQIDTAYDLVRSYVQARTSELKQTAAALEQTVRMVSGLPGRRSVLYVSGGLEQRPGEELYQELADAFGQAAIRDQTSQMQTVIEPSAEALQSDQSELFDDVSRAANAERVTLYTLDARGNDGGSMASAENGSRDLGSGISGRIGIEQMRNSNLVEPLIALAADTGGTSIINSNNLDNSLASMAADFDSYYSLGYRSPHGGDGELHKIEVHTNRPGLTLRYRTSYVDKPQVERVADRTVSSLLLDLQSNPLGVSVDFGPPERKAGRRYVLPVLVRVPISKVTLLPNGGRREGRLEFFVVVKDDDGGISDLHRQPYPVAIDLAKLDEAMGKEIGYLAKLELRPGKPMVAVGVWDEIAGTESFVQKQALVNAATAKAQQGR